MNFKKLQGVLEGLKTQAIEQIDEPGVWKPTSTGGAKMSVNGIDFTIFKDQYNVGFFKIRAAQEGQTTLFFPQQFSSVEEAKAYVKSLEDEQ